MSVSSNADGAIESLSNLVHLEGHILSTRSADGFKGIHKNSNQPVLVWKLRHPLAPQSDAARRFLGRMQSMRDLRLPGCEIINFGVDSHGAAFAVLTELDGKPLAGGISETNDAERRFISCVKLVEQLHLAGAVCGDICAASFWLRRNSDVAFIGLMGSFDTEASATAMLPPIETLHFVAPEQRAGGGIEQASDVFSLGVLGYLLLSGKFPFGGQSPLIGGPLALDKIKPIASFNHSAPAWADAILRRCLDPVPSARFQSAGAVLQEIARARGAVSGKAQLPARVVKDNPNTRALDHSSTHAPMARSRSSDKSRQAAQKDSSGGPSKLFLVVGGLGVMALSAILVWKFTHKEPATEQRLNADLSTHLDAANSAQIKDAIDIVRAPEMPMNSKTQQLDNLVSADDPLAHAVLVKTAVDAESEELREAAEKSVLARARRLGLIRSAEHVKQWLRFRKQGEIPPGYAAILKSLDVSLPVDARSGIFREAYQGNERTVLRLAAAVALDTGKLDEYQPLLAQLVGDSQHFDEANKHSSVGLILYNPELALAFGDDVVQQIDKVADDEVLWLLKILGDRNDVNVKALAQRAITQNLLPKRRGIFLDVVKARDDISADLLASLVRGAAGALRKEDLASFGTWYDRASVKLLFAVCADSYDEDLLKDAFDILAGKSFSDEPGASLIKWMRQEQWEKRSKFVKATAILQDLDNASPEDIDAALEAYGPYMRDSSLMNIFIDTKSPVLITSLLKKFGEGAGSVTLGVLLNLLDAGDKTIRIEALKLVAKYNDLGVLKIVLDHYEREKDPEVKELYREKFWMIKQKEAK